MRRGAVRRGAVRRRAVRRGAVRRRALPARSLGRVRAGATRGSQEFASRLRGRSALRMGARAKTTCEAKQRIAAVSSQAHLGN